MTWQWSDTLKEPMATRLRGEGWGRIERAGSGAGWVVLGDGPTDWFRFADDESEFVPLSPTEDPRLPQISDCVTEWHRSGWELSILSYRVGRRVVLQLTAPGSPWRIAKLYRRESAQADRWRALAGHGPEQGWRVPEVLEWDHDQRRLEVEYRPGESLHRIWASGRGRPTDGDRIASLLEWIASAPIPESFPRHTPEDEIVVLERRMRVFEELIAEPPARARELVAEIGNGLGELTVDHWGLAHRDLHDKQIIVEESGGTLLDLDLCAAAPAGLDCGNILAQLHLRALQETPLPWVAIAERIAAPFRRDHDPETLRLWTASTLVRLALLYALRSRPQSLVGDLLRSAEEALRGEGQWKGPLG